MEHKGEIFEIGKLYKFKDNGPTDWVVGKLEYVDPDGRFRCRLNDRVNEPFDMIVEISANELGNIVQKPVELISGKCYAFDSRGQRYEGFYSKPDNTMISMLGRFHLGSCSNFVELGEPGNV